MNRHEGGRFKGRGFRGRNDKFRKSDRGYTDRDSDAAMEDGESSRLPKNMRSRFKYTTSPSRGGPANRVWRPGGKGNFKRSIMTYIKDNANDLRKPRAGERFWYKIVVPYGRKWGKQFIFENLFRLCDNPFRPFNFQLDGNMAVFFINNYNACLELRNMDRKIETPSGQRLSIIVRNADYPSCSHDSPVVEKYVTEALVQRQAESRLNMVNFAESPPFDAVDLFVPISRTPMLAFVTKMFVDLYPYLTVIDFSLNNLEMLSGMSQLTKLKQLLGLKLGNNRITRVIELDHIKGLEIEELILDGNPVVGKFKDKDDYVSEIRKRFPKVIRLDGTELPKPIVFDLGEKVSLPPPQASCLPDDGAKDLVIRFVQEFFTCFDSSDRGQLLAAYHDNAVFSNSAMKLHTASKDFLEFVKTSRNLLKIQNFREARDMLYRGRLPIVEHYKRFPRTQHIPDSFTLDIPLLTPVLMQFVVSGVFRTVNSDGIVQAPLRSFQRSFTVIPQNTGFVIINEMLFISNASERQVRQFPFHARASSPLRSNTSNNNNNNNNNNNSRVVMQPGGIDMPAMPLESPPVVSAAQTKLVILQRFMTTTGMNDAFSERCLEQNEWNYDKAFHVFTELRTRNAIPPEAFSR